MIDEDGFRALNHNFEHWFEPVDNDRRPDLDGDQFWFKEAIRYFFAWGGRGGGKSEFTAEILLILARNYRLKILCVREFQNSIDDSVLSVLKRKIEEMEQSGELEVGFFTIKNNAVHGANDSLFTFSGLARNIGSIKSKDFYDICWIEEGQYVSAKAWELLDPTIRKEGSIMIITMNRDSEDSCLDRQFIQNTPPSNSIVTKVNYYDNPYDIPVLKQMALDCKISNMDVYLHVWEGELNNISEAQVLHGKWRVARFETPENVTFYHGADWSNGGSDPHTVIRFFISQNTLYIDYEVETHVDMDLLHEEWRKIPSLRYNPEGWIVYADNARPDMIRHMNKKGYNVKPAPKSWQGGSKEGDVKNAGKDWMRAFDAIVIHERCTGTIKEATNWKWEIDDRTGDIIPKYVKGFDHLICDALRYGGWKMIKRKHVAEMNQYGGNR